MEALSTAARVLGLEDAAALQVVDTFGGSDRSEVWRVRVDRRSPAATTVVVKHYPDRSLGTWRRESAALAAAGGVRAPELLGVSARADEPAVVVMSDLGSGPSLADLLLARGADAPRRAGAGLVAWAAAVGDLHRSTADRRSVFADALGADLRADAVLEELEELPTGLAPLLAEHDLPWSDDVPESVAALAAGLADPGDQVLSTGDPCPDNNVLTADGMVLLDFEYAQLRHRAWDAAYLRVPWASCWCAWQVPEEHAQRALATLVDRSYGASGPPAGFADALDAATTLWCVLSTRWFLAGALDPDAVNTDLDRRPGRWTMILHRLDLAARTPGPEPLRRWAAATRAELRARWGGHRLRPAPAYR